MDQRRLGVADRISDHRVLVGHGAVETGIGGQGIASDQLRQALPGIVDLGGDDKVAICCREDAIECGGRQVMASLRGDNRWLRGVCAALFLSK